MRSECANASAAVAAIGMIIILQISSLQAEAPQSERKQDAVPQEQEPGLVNKNSLYQFNGVFTDTTGKEFKLVQLEGKPSVVVMAYTSCDYSCPIVVGRMKRIEAALPSDIQNRVHFVLVSFDTERDTAEKLRNYATKMHLDERRWTLLHGGKDDILELAVLLGVKFKSDGKGGFSHSNLITVLDREGKVIHRLIGLNTDLDQTVRVFRRIASAGRRDNAALSSTR